MDVMKSINKTYRFKLNPTEEQKVFINKHFGCVRFVYNYFLNQRKEQYQKDKKSDSYNAQAKALTLLKKEENTSWLSEVNAQTLQYSLKCLDIAYINFFKKRSSFPKFKTKKVKIVLLSPNQLN